MKTAVIAFLIWTTIGIAALIGEGLCIYKFCKCDFEPGYKAECIYGVSMITGIGCITGYMDFGK